MKKYAGLVLSIFICMGLGGCGTAWIHDHERLQADAEPLRDLAVVIWMGNMANMSAAGDTDRHWYDHEFKDALSTRFPAIFRANGLPLKQLVISNALPQKNEWPKVNIDFSDVSHVLVLRAYSYFVGGGRTAIYFEAYLWDARTKRAVWKAMPDVGVVTSQPLLRAQVFAGELLNTLKKDHFIRLKNENAIDLEGNTITNGYYIGSPDK